MYGQEFIGKEIAIYFDDGSNITRKDGICKEILDHAVIFTDKNTGYQSLIPFYKIVRIIEKPQEDAHNDG